MGSKGSEGKVQSIKFPNWMSAKLKMVAENEKSTVSDIVIKFCEHELNAMGIYWKIGSHSENPQKIDLEEVASQ